MIYNNLTPRAQQAIANAKKEALGSNHCFVEPEHLLLGLMDLPNGPVWELMTALGVSVDKLRIAIAGKYTEDGDEQVMGEPIFSAPTRSALTYAGQFVKLHGHKRIYDLHLLLGLMHEGSSLACAFMESAGLTEEKVQKEIEERFGAELKQEKDPEER